MEKAEGQCRVLYMGSILWSPAYIAAYLLLEYWLNRRNIFCNQHTNIRQLIVRQNKLKLMYNSTFSLTSIEDNIKSALKTKNSAKI